MSIDIEKLKSFRSGRLRRAWLVLGAEPGPGPDIRIRPLDNLVFRLEPVTTAGETFTMLFYAALVIPGGAKLAQFKRHCDEFGLTAKTLWAEQEENL